MATEETFRVYAARRPHASFQRMETMAVDTTSLQALLVAERPRLEALARRLVWDDEDARDLVQTAFVTALSKWPGYRGDGSPQGWLRRILVHHALSHLRRRKLFRSLASLLFVVPDPVVESDPHHALGQQRHLKAVSEALEKLSARQRAAFILRYLEGLSIDEVADALDIGRGTARVHLQRAVKALRAQGLLEEGGEGEA